MLKVLVGYPSSTEEFVIVERMTGLLQSVQRVLSTEEPDGPPAEDRPRIRRPRPHRVPRSTWSRRRASLDCVDWTAWRGTSSSAPAHAPRST